MFCSRPVFSLCVEGRYVTPTDAGKNAENATSGVAFSGDMILSRAWRQTRRRLRTTVCLALCQERCAPMHPVVVTQCLMVFAWVRENAAPGYVMACTLKWWSRENVTIFVLRELPSLGTLLDLPSPFQWWCYVAHALFSHDLPSNQVPLALPTNLRFLLYYCHLRFIVRKRSSTHSPHHPDSIAPNDYTLQGK